MESSPIKKCMYQNLVVVFQITFKNFNIFGLFQKAVVKDIASFGYTTTIGLSQFYKLLLNYVLHLAVDPKGGCLSKVATCFLLIKIKYLYILAHNLCYRY